VPREQWVEQIAGAKRLKKMFHDLLDLERRLRALEASVSTSADREPAS
jgi:hypothetical protein